MRRPISQMLHKRFFITLPKEVCRLRRATRTYDPPDPPGYFEATIWPMYLHNKRVMERMHAPGDIIYLDGTRSLEQLFQQISKELSLL